MKVGHIGLNVNDIEVSKKFYMELFDFELINESLLQNEKFSFLGNNNKILVTLWEQSNKKFSTSTAGLHHLAFEVENIEKLKYFEKKVNSLQIKKIYDDIVLHNENADSGGIFFLDPDGIRIEIYVKNDVKSIVKNNNVSRPCGFF